MGAGMFVDREHQPTAREISAAIGSRRSLWENLIQFIADNYRIKGDLTFLGKNYGWALRFRKGGKALTTLYPAKETFIAQIVIGPNQAEKAFGLDLGKKVRRTLEDAHPYHDGRWLFIKVRSKRDLNDVQQLLMLKSRPAMKE